MKNSDIEKQRAAITQANVNDDDASGCFFIQILIVALVVALIKKSWIIFFGVLIGSFVLISIPYIGIIFALALAVVYGYIGYFLGGGLAYSLIYALSDSYSMLHGSEGESWVEIGGFIVGGLVFLASLGANLIGGVHLKDINRK